MADKAILNVAFYFGPIHLTVNRVTLPVSTEFFALGLDIDMGRRLRSRKRAENEKIGQT